MIPRILEYEDNRVKVTAEAYGIPEIKAILDKHDMKAEPYLAYVCAFVYPDSPYVNIPDAEKQESIAYDIQVTYGDFDMDDELLVSAIDRLKALMTTKTVALADELGNEIDRLRLYMKNSPIMDGEGGNLKDRISLMKDISKIATEYQKVREMADKELKVAVKGDHELGGY